ncbi:PorV/PorQ family protein [Candidatus Aerophobetes bacterium]|nr:PorV/PorQ family protein [Candidatus Aerophobetes bacterium]
MKKFTSLIIGILLLGIGANSYAASSGTTGADFLNIGVGEKAVAMGEAFSAIADDSTAPYWNPAGLVQLEKKEFLASYNLWLQGIGQGYLSLVLPSVANTISLGMNYLGTSMEIRDEECEARGRFTASNFYLFAAYAKKISEKLSLGLMAGYLQETIGEYRQSAFLSNLGLLYFLNKRFSLAVVAQNLGTQIGAAPLPSTLRAGISFRGGDLVLATDIVKPIYSDLYLCFGGEWRISKRLSFRLGYKSGQDIGPGLSTGIGFETEGYQVNYAYVPYGDLGGSHRISLGIRF